QPRLLDNAIENGRCNFNGEPVGFKGQENMARLLPSTIRPLKHQPDHPDRPPLNIPPFSPVLGPDAQPCILDSYWSDHLHRGRDGGDNKLITG
ncbi:hypothetical protein KUCAC02_024497, partial [Chaenocephalus aceratus]